MQISFAGLKTEVHHQVCIALLTEENATINYDYRRVCWFSSEDFTAPEFSVINQPLEGIIKY